MTEDLEREFPSVSPKADVVSERAPFEDPAVQRELNEAKPPHSMERALDDFVRDKVAEFALRHPNATPEELAAAETATRTTAELLLNAPNIMAADEQISRDSAEAARHSQEVIEAADDAGELATEQEVTISDDNDPHETTEQQEPLTAAIEAAAKVGIKDESELQQISVLLGPKEKPLDQRDMLYRLIQRKGYRSTPEELKGIMRNYLKESIKAKEKGLLLHYHQTALENLESIVRNGALLSQDERRVRGEKFASTGARPDVVQMTRDSYDSDGNLFDAGLKDSSGNLITQGGLAFVFDESVMDEPDYDCTNEYPNLPRISLDKLKAVVVNDENDIPHAKEVLYKKGFTVSVVSRSVWLKGYKT